MTGTTSRLHASKPESSDLLSSGAGVTASALDTVDAAVWIHRGVWSSATAYAVNDLVDHVGVTWLGVSAGTNHEPPEVVYWKAVGVGPSYIPVVAPPVVVAITPAGPTPGLPAATVGIPYFQTLVAAGGTSPYTWSVSNGTLPAGLVLNPTTGVLSGTPTAAATSIFAVAAVAAGGNSGTMSYDFVVNAAAVSNPAHTDNFDDNSLNAAFWATTGTVTETGGRQRIAEGGSTATTTAESRNLAQYWPRLQLFTDGDANGITTYRIDTADFSARVIQNNATANLTVKFYESAVLKSTATYPSLTSGAWIGFAYASSSVAVQTSTDGQTFTLLTSYYIADATRLATTAAKVECTSAVTPSISRYAQIDNFTFLTPSSVVIQSAYSDNFDAAVVDTSKWVVDNTVDQVGGVLRCHENFGRITSIFARDMSAGFEMVVQMLPDSDPGGRTICGVKSSDATLTWRAIQSNLSGVCAVEIVDTTGSVDTDYFVTSVPTQGEYLRFSYAGGSLQALRGSSSAGPWVLMQSYAITSSRVTSMKAVLVVTNETTIDASRYGRFDNLSFELSGAAPPPPPPPPPSGNVEILLWDGIASMYDDAVNNNWAKHHQMNSYGIESYVEETVYLAGFGGSGNWSTDAGGYGNGADASYPNAQQQIGTSTQNASTGRLGRPSYLGIYFRPGDTHTPAFADVTGFSAYCTAMQHASHWASAGGFLGWSFDEEGGDWDWHHIDANEATARARAYSCGSELMTKILTGWPTGMEILVYSGEFTRTWRQWQTVWYNTDNFGVQTHVDWDTTSVNVDFWAGMCSVSGFAGISFLQAAFYKDTQAQLDNAGPVSFSQAFNADVFGYRPAGTIPDKWGVAHAGMLGWDWYFHNRLNDAGQVDKLSWLPFFWVDGSNPGDGEYDFSAPRSPSYVANQFLQGANMVLSLPYRKKMIGMFDFRSLGFLAPTSEWGGYASYANAGAFNH